MRKFLSLLLLTLLASFSVQANEWDAVVYQQIEQSIQVPQISGKDYLITKFGARPDASAADNQKAIQKAIDKCAKKGGGRVVVPAGQTFLTAAIHLKSHVDLHIEEGATLLFAFKPDLYPIVETTWEGLDCFNLSPCIYANGQTDIAITGKGVIDGGGSNEAWWPWVGVAHFGWKEGGISQSREARPRLLRCGEDGVPMRDEQGQPVRERSFGPQDGLRPQLVNFYQCQRVLIEDVTLLDSPFWVIHPLRSTDVTVRRVHINNAGPNGDGCDPESCDRVLIEDCFFNTGDDCIVIKTTQPDAPCRNITVTNCVLETSCAAIKIGTESHSDFSDLRFSNITIKNTTVGCGLFVKDGATMERISFHNISYTYADKEHQKTSIPMYIDVEKRHDNSRLGRVRDISFTNWHIASDVNCVFQSVPESPIQNVTLSNITIRAKKEADRSIRQKSAGSGNRTAKDNGNESVLVQYPAWIAFKNAENLTIRDVSVYQDEGAKGIDMSALYFENVKEVFTENIRLFGAAEGGRPLIACKEEA